MISLPEVLQVSVCTTAGERLADVLVSVQFSREGRYYYGTSAGLTDSSGRVQRTAEEITRDFEVDQRLFPMDYRVPLGDCDPVVTVVVRGGTDFENLRRAVEENPLSDADVLDQYRYAVNTRMKSAEVRAAVPSGGGGTMTVRVVVPPPDRESAHPEGGSSG